MVSLKLIQALNGTIMMFNVIDTYLLLWSFAKTMMSSLLVFVYKVAILTIVAYAIEIAIARLCYC
jgi:hypothetical protein